MTQPTTAEERFALADRVHFTGRHDDVDPSPGPAECADTDCMTLRRLIADLEEAVTIAQQATGLLDLITGLAEHLAEGRHLKPVEKRALKAAANFLEEKP